MGRELTSFENLHHSLPGQRFSYFQTDYGIRESHWSAVTRWVIRSARDSTTFNLIAASMYEESD